jgi:hypothetical protein
MPKQFDEFGVKFLYPDNWTVAPREDQEGEQGVTLETPGGGFVAIEVIPAGDTEEIVDRIVQAIREDYEEVERDETTLERLPVGASVTDLRFYYLDLLVVSRIVILPDPSNGSALAESALAESALAESAAGQKLMIQLQAESRDFDKNAPVLEAIVKQISG